MTLVADLLDADHKQVKAMFKEFEELTGSKAKFAMSRKPELAHEICQALKVHTAIEEEIFYPGLVSALGEAGSKLLKQDSARHDNVKRLFGELLGMKVGEGRYALRYFQLLEGNWQLPTGFVPDRVRIIIAKDGRQPAQELLAEWSEVLKPLVTQPAPLPVVQ